MQHPKTWRREIQATPVWDQITSSWPASPGRTTELRSSLVRDEFALRGSQLCGRSLIFWAPPPAVLRAVLISSRHVTGKLPNHWGLFPWSYPPIPQTTGVYIFIPLCWISTFSGTQILTFTPVRCVCVCARACAWAHYCRYGFIICYLFEVGRHVVHFISDYCIYSIFTNLVFPICKLTIPIWKEGRKKTAVLPLH